MQNSSKRFNIFGDTFTFHEALFLILLPKQSVTIWHSVNPRWPPPPLRKFSENSSNLVQINVPNIWVQVETHISCSRLFQKYQLEFQQACWWMWKNEGTSWTDSKINSSKYLWWSSWKKNYLNTFCTEKSCNVLVSFALLCGFAVHFWFAHLQQLENLAWKWSTARNRFRNIWGSCNLQIKIKPHTFVICAKNPWWLSWLYFWPGASLRLASTPTQSNSSSPFHGIIVVRWW